jgi:hypothetical protein
MMMILQSLLEPGLTHKTYVYYHWVSQRSKGCLIACVGDARRVADTFKVQITLGSIMVGREGGKGLVCRLQVAAWQGSGGVKKSRLGEAMVRRGWVCAHIAYTVYELTDAGHDHVMRDVVESQFSSLCCDLIQPVNNIATYGDW